MTKIEVKEQKRELRKLHTQVRTLIDIRDRLSAEIRQKHNEIGQEEKVYKLMTGKDFVVMGYDDGIPF